MDDRLVVAAFQRQQILREAGIAELGFFQRRLQRGQRNNPRGARKGAKHQRVGDRPLEDFEGDFNGVAQADSTHRIRNHGVFKRFVRRLHQRAAGFDAGENIDRPRQCRIDADDAIGVVDIGQLTNDLVAATQKGDDRRAASLEAESRDRYRVLALCDQRRRQHGRGHDGALTATTVESNFVHLVSFCSVWMNLRGFILLYFR